jgi:cupin 2 domain-containing protein
LLWRKGLRIERIVSTAQRTPADKPYNQEYDEWVLLVFGSAGLWIEGESDGRCDFADIRHAIRQWR